MCIHPIRKFKTPLRTLTNTTSISLPAAVLVRYKPKGRVYHLGDPPDERMTEAADRRGVKLSGASRPLSAEDLEKFDLIVGMVR